VELVSTTESNVLVEMSVQDDGRGMSESELDALFQDFEQVLDDEENYASGLYNDNGKSHPEPVKGWSRFLKKPTTYLPLKMKILGRLSQRLYRLA
jgi:hypothetical protein